jgi:hypothetical protein
MGPDNKKPASSTNTDAGGQSVFCRAAPDIKADQIEGSGAPIGKMMRMMSAPK